VTSGSSSLPARIRREPPRFRRVTVDTTSRLGPRMVRVRFVGEELDGFVVDEPAASVRLLIPSPGSTELVMPAWNGNVFLLPDGTRAAIRTFTPRFVDPAVPALDIDIVLHGSTGGAASAWAATASEGAAAAVSGPGLGYVAVGRAGRYLLVGDETAIPAISQLLETLADSIPVAVHIEVSEAGGRVPVPEHPGATVTWHELPAGAPPGDELVGAVRTDTVTEDTVVWAAGEAAAMQRIRRHLFEERGVPRGRATVRGYWKHGRSGDPSEGDPSED